MRLKYLVVVLLVLIVITLSSCSKPYDMVIEKGEVDTKEAEMETHYFTEQMYYLMGDWRPVATGANPSFIIRNITGVNLFEVDHEGEVFVKEGNLDMNSNNIMNVTNVTTAGIIINTTAGATCPRIYINGSGCFIFESCDGGGYATGSGC